jgi:hypothetical protein
VVFSIEQLLGLVFFNANVFIIIIPVIGIFFIVMVVI